MRCASKWRPRPRRLHRRHPPRQPAAGAPSAAAAGGAFVLTGFRADPVVGGSHAHGFVNHDTALAARAVELVEDAAASEGECGVPRFKERE